MDLRIYSLGEQVSKFPTYYEYGHAMHESVLDAAPSTGMEVLSGKVVKYLLTIKGTDIFSPAYGCNVSDYRGLYGDVRKFKMEVLKALQDCTAFIKQKETAETEVRLQSLTLEKLVYDRKKSPGRVDIFIKITTTAGEQSLLEVPVNGSDGDS